MAPKTPRVYRLINLVAPKPPRVYRLINLSAQMSWSLKIDTLRGHKQHPVYQWINSACVEDDSLHVTNGLTSLPALALVVSRGAAEAQRRYFQA